MNSDELSRINAEQSRKKLVDECREIMERLTKAFDEAFPKEEKKQNVIDMRNFVRRKYR
jgi:flagellin-specific chaperone FliS